MHFAERRPASSGFQDSLLRQLVLVRFHETDQLTNGGGLADSDTPDEGDPMLAGPEECGVPVQLLFVEVHLADEDVDQVGIRLQLPQLLQSDVDLP